MCEEEAGQPHNETYHPLSHKQRKIKEQTIKPDKFELNSRIKKDKPNDDRIDRLLDKQVVASNYPYVDFVGTACMPQLYRVISSCRCRYVRPWIDLHMSAPARR